MHVNRQELLQRLEAVAPGLATRETVEQSACFAFKDNLVQTYNGQIACTFACPTDFTGAVSAAPLLAMLNKMAEETLELVAEGGELRVMGKGRRAGIRMEADITLPTEGVEKPTAWQALDRDFCSAVATVAQCAGKDDANGFYLTCIHIHPEWVEACDNWQLSRFPLATGVAKPIQVKKEDIKHISALDMTEMCVTRSWVHFRNPTGLVLSCRQYEVDFPDVGAVLATRGAPTTLPGGLADAVDKASVFSAENADNDNVCIDLRPEKLRLTGRGATGWYQEFKKVNYNGPAMSFSIAPKLLTEITKRHNECEVGVDTHGNRILRVNGGKFTYISCLGEIEDNRVPAPAPTPTEAGDER